MVSISFKEAWSALWRSSRNITRGCPLVIKTLKKFRKVISKTFFSSAGPGKATGG